MDREQQTAVTRFLSLLRPIEGDLENYSRRMVFDRRDFEDALQNAVLRAFAAFDRYHDDASFRAWMFKILTNEIFALNRRYGRIAHFEFHLEPEEMDALLALKPADDGQDSRAAPDAAREALDDE